MSIFYDYFSFKLVIFYNVKSFNKQWLLTGRYNGDCGILKL